MDPQCPPARARDRRRGRPTLAWHRSTSSGLPPMCELTHLCVLNSIRARGRPDLKRRLYPAVLERGSRNALGAWFPDFPGCVAGGRSQEEAIERAERALAQAGDGWAEQGRAVPGQTRIGRTVRPDGCNV